MASAKLVVACAFNELRITDVSRTQLQSAAKTLKLPLKESELRSKDRLVVNVAKALIDMGFVKVPAAQLTFSRADVKILKPF